MPLTGKSIGSDIEEFHSGPTYSKTREKFGKVRADKQAIAVAYNSRRNEKDRQKKTRRGFRGK